MDVLLLERNEYSLLLDGLINDSCCLRYVLLLERNVYLLVHESKVDVLLLERDVYALLLEGLVSDNVLCMHCCLRYVLHVLI